MSSSVTSQDGDRSDSNTANKLGRWRVRDAIKPPFTLDLVWVVLPFSLVLLCFGMLPLRSWDYWWHLTIGRLIDYYNAVPVANHYLYTMDPQAPSFVQPWMSQWLLFELHDFGGLQLVLLVRNLIAAMLAGFLGFGAMRRSRSAMNGAVLALLGFALAFPFIAARPHLFVLPLFALLVWLGFQIRHGRFSMLAMLLFPATTALWANLHGSFFVPSAIALAFGAAALCEHFDPRDSGHRIAQVADSNKQAIGWFITLALSLVAPLINPRGAELYGYVLDLSTNAEIQNTVTEWMATTLSNPPGVGILFYLVLGGAGVVFWRKRRRVDLGDLFLFAGFAVMTILAARAMLWFALVLPFVLARYLRSPDDAHAEHNSETPPGWVRALNLLLAFGLVVAAFILQPGTIYHRDFVTAYPAIPTRGEAPLRGLVKADTPVVSAAILKQHPGPMHLFHDQKYAGYLLFHLATKAPAPMVFVDQRIELPPDRIWRLYDQINTTSAWKGIFQQYDIRAAVLNKETQPFLIQNMRADSDWKIHHENAFNVLFIRKN